MKASKINKKTVPASLLVVIPEEKTVEVIFVNYLEWIILNLGVGV